MSSNREEAAFPFTGRRIPLGRVAGIRIALDWSWFIIGVVLVLTFLSLLAKYFPRESPAVLAVWAILGTVVFFSSLLAHELSHCLVGRAQGIVFDEIVLFAFGGVSRMRSEATRPEVELRMAAAGPLTSAILGIAFALASRIFPDDRGSELLLWLGMANVGLAVFNLVPAFPLDGGRIFRSILWGLTGDPTRATRWASAAGMIFGGVLMFVGGVSAFLECNLVGGLWLGLIGWFLRTAAQGERSRLELNLLLESIAAGPAAEDPPRVEAREPLSDVLERRMLPTGRTLFLVEREGSPAGLLTFERLLAVAPRLRPATAAEQVMVPLDRCPAVKAEDSLRTVLDRLAGGPISYVRVLREGAYAGVIGPTQIARVAHVRTAADRRSRQPGPHPEPKKRWMMGHETPARGRS